MRNIRQIYFKETFEVLTNPGMGFKTMGRFNGDLPDYRHGFSGGVPEQAEPGCRITPNFPMASMAYFRPNWRKFNPQEDVYDWTWLDDILARSRAAGQSLYLRVGPYGLYEVEHPADPKHRDDVPPWVRAKVGPAPKTIEHFSSLDHNHPGYYESFAKFLWAMAARYNGHPDLECVDISLCGAWGEGGGTGFLTEPVFETLMDPYVKGFDRTLLVVQPKGTRSVAYARAHHPRCGWRVDCWGDLGGFDSEWCHMYDSYPDDLFERGCEPLWQTAPVSLEACWVIQHWFNNKWDIDEVIDHSLRWHINNFNNKSSAIPPEWRSEIDYWQRKMGYRIVPRKVRHSGKARAGESFYFNCWWTNAGVAPAYYRYPLMLRLQDDRNTYTVELPYDVRAMMPGDSYFAGSVALPAGMPPGTYQVSMAFYDRPGSPKGHCPGIKMAVKGTADDGWQPLGAVAVE